VLVAGFTVPQRAEVVPEADPASATEPGTDSEPAQDLRATAEALHARLLALRDTPGAAVADHVNGGE
jgi:hypothetical protein